MRQISCNVIKDLLPSYIDQICSEDSCKLVEDHLLTCSTCKLAVEQMTTAEPSAIQGLPAPQPGLLQNLQKKLAHKNRITATLFLAVILICLAFLVRYAGHLPFVLYQILLPIILFGFYFILGDFSPQKSQQKWEPICLLPLLLTFGTIFSLACYFAENPTDSFLEASQTGPFMTGILYFFLCLYIAMLAIFLKNHVRQLQFSIFTFASGSTGLILTMNYLAGLYNITNFRYYIEFLLKDTAVLFAECLVFIAITLFIRKKRNTPT